MKIESLLYKKFEIKTGALVYNMNGVIKLCEKGEIEIKELWISAFFYRTQVAIRGNVPREVFEEYLASLV